MRGKLRPMDDRCRKKLAMALFDFVTEVGPDLLDAKQLARVLAGLGLRRIQPLVWVVLTKLENSLARSNRSRFG